MNKQELKEKKFEWNIAIFISAFTSTYFIINLLMLGPEREIPKTIGLIVVVLGVTFNCNLFHNIIMRLNLKQKEEDKNE